MHLVHGLVQDLDLVAVRAIDLIREADLDVHPQVGVGRVAVGVIVDRQYVAAGVPESQIPDSDRGVPWKPNPGLRRLTGGRRIGEWLGGLGVLSGNRGPHHADGQDHGYEGSHQYRGHRAGQRPAVASIVQNGEQPTFQVRGASHGDCGCTRPGAGTRPRGDLQDLLSVVARRRPGGEDEIIARPLALRDHAAGGDPHQRIERVQGTSQSGDELHQRVSAFDMSQFVQQDGVAARGRPIVSFCRQEQSRPEDAPHHRHCPVFALQQ